MPMVIQSLHVYPVKGLGGFSPGAWEVTPTGLRFDRHWMLVDESTGAFVSQRQVTAMAQITATLSENLAELRLDASDWRWSCAVDAQGEIRKTSIWGDVVHAVDLGDEIAKRLSTRLARKVRLVRFGGDQHRPVDSFWTGDEHSHTHFADFGPMLVTTQASLDDLNQRRVERGLAVVEMNRFRANIVLGGIASDEAWHEDQWGSLTIDNALVVDLIKPCARCKVIEVDQTTGESTGDGVLESLAAFRRLKNRSGKLGVMFGQDAVARFPILPDAKTGWPRVEVGSTVVVTAGE